MTRSFVLLNPETSADRIACVFRRLTGLIMMNRCQCVSFDAIFTLEEIRCVFKHRAPAQSEEAAILLSNKNIFCFDVRGPDALSEARKIFSDYMPSLHPGNSTSDLRIAFITQSLDEVNACQAAIESMHKKM